MKPTLILTSVVHARKLKNLALSRGLAQAARQVWRQEVVESEMVVALPRASFAKRFHFVLGAVLLFAFMPCSRAQSFIHPGTLQTQADLDRMRTNVINHVQPWYGTFQVFQPNGYRLGLGWLVGHTGWLLQAQTNPFAGGLGTNWFSIPDSDLTNLISVSLIGSNASVFYRLLQP